MKKFNMCVRAMGMAALGLSLMGNQSCEQQPVAEARKLKWYADAGRITSPPVQFGEAGNFDFGYVASEQLYGVLFNSKGFTASYKGPVVTNGAKGLELVGAQGMYQKVFGEKTVGSELYFSDEAKCLISLPDVRVYGAVNSFEMSSGNNISIGFNQGTGAVHSGIGLGGTFNVTVKNLNMQMYALDIAKDFGTNNYKLIDAPLINEKSKDTDGKISLSYSQIGVGYGWYKTTPLSVITERGLKQGIDKIKDAMNKVAWNTKVLDIKPFGGGNSGLGDSGVVIKGGADVELKKGDQVQFFEDKTLWSGEPCKSDYYGFARFNPNPIAIGEVVHLDRNFSTVAITQRFDNREIKAGWRVELLKRIEDIEAEKKSQQAKK